VTCGYWCNCGLCGDDPTLPCFQTGDCPQGLTCTVPTGTGSSATAPQLKPNDCSSDKSICGVESTEKCANTFVGTCSLADYRTCEIDEDCETFNAGTCVIDNRRCFEPRITRTGSPSPLGTYCAFADKSCTSNVDCTGLDDFCVPDSSRPTTVALFCVPTSKSPAVNKAGGIMGPGAISLKSLLEVCRCGDGKVGCDEQCDDSNTVDGDGCDDFCQQE
jgi:cysteine-rich repeat protein